MTKQEHIEEMAKFMHYKAHGKDKDCDNEKCEMCWCSCKNDAELLYNAGYRKIDDNCVVLSREEYEDYKKHVDNCVEEYHRGQHEAELYYKNIQIPRERKETADKILFKFESAFAYYDNEDMFSKKAIFECLEEIVKSLGVEIKE